MSKDSWRCQKAFNFFHLLVSKAKLKYSILFHLVSPLSEWCDIICISICMILCNKYYTFCWDIKMSIQTFSAWWTLGKVNLAVLRKSNARVSSILFLFRTENVSSSSKAFYAYILKSSALHVCTNNVKCVQTLSG